ncbi:phospholipase D family protein [Pseudomonas fluorescens BBc6R8]|uniref:phospholipase D family protein n=1 Tax=Pseudomonas fluorescens TaxID=294 RepID=UPI000281CB4D|nr:phospholipase D family protein [Pseudomonas fluorescens]QQD55329.1 phospholipase D family protein [Pseudomonas fluorescens BBc6R8]
MFIGPEQYPKALRAMVAQEASLDVAVAFWGDGADATIHPDGGKPLRVICNLRSGGTNPAVIKLLVDRAKAMAHVQIRQSDRLHAKLVVGPTSAIIGSANVSANGLGFEGVEVAHWLEAAIQTVERDEVESAQEWFNRLWLSTDSRPITYQDLADATETYEKNRDGRPDYSRKGPFTFDNYSVADLEGRNAYALLYTSRPGPEAEARAKQHEDEQLIEHGSKEQGGEGVERWSFETWPDSLDTTEKNEYLCIIWNENGGVAVDGACRMTGTKLSFIYEGSNKDGWVDLAKPSITLLGRRLLQVDRQRIAKSVRPKIEAIWNAAEELDPDARRIHLSELKRILQAQ